MRYRDFGRLNWKGSVLGFGCMRLPVRGKGNGGRDILVSEATRMLRHAIDNGVNYVDTAYSYHGGESERVVGRALGGGYRRRVRLATKMPVWLAKSAADFDRLLNEQMKRLRTDHIDFYLLHALCESTWRKVHRLGVLEWLDRARRSGRIGQFGFSFHDEYGVLKEIIDASDQWTVCLLQFNYMDIRNQGGLAGVRHAASKGLAVVVMEPLRGGQLAKPPPRILEIWNRAARKRTPADWGLQWVWTHPEVSVVLSGMSSMQQVEENLASARRSGPGALSREELALFARVRARYRELSPIACTQCGYCLPCPEGVLIPRNFSIYNDGAMYSDPKGARGWYANWLDDKEQAGACAACRRCESRCPQKLPISSWMKKVHAALGEGQPFATSPD